MSEVRKDTWGIVDAAQLMRRVSFRRVPPAQPLRRWIEHYWLIDWELSEPYEQHVVPHPCVNLVFQRYGDEPEWVEVAGVGLELFSIKLEGMGRVGGVQFRPGGYRPFHRRAVSELTGQRVVLPPPEVGVLDGDDAARTKKIDAYLLACEPETDPQADAAMRLVDAIRHDRAIRRVEDFAAQQGFSTRGLQRLFAEYVGVSPKWVILRYRLHEALEQASPQVDWARLATDLGYSDQAHLVREFTAMLGVSPAAYAKALSP